MLIFHMKKLVWIFGVLAGLAGCGVDVELEEGKGPGNVVFIHPDGTGVGHWNILRMLTVGPDGLTHWDQMDRLGVYRPHQSNYLSTTSHAGATVHAYGKKVHYDSYGLDRTDPLTALSGKEMTILQEAQSEGLRVGIVNSGHIGEPGTGVFLASSEKRSNVELIAAQIFESGAHVIFCGGEIYCLPKGEVGVHGKEGVREDGRNLLEEAKAAGYTVIFTKEELFNVPVETEKVIGIFAARNTYNDRAEEILAESGLPAYNPDEPSFDEMVDVALKVLSNDPQKRFFLVAEEEGTDNFSNNTNAYGTVEALKRTDAAIGIVMDFMENREKQDTLLVVAADSDAGHPSIWSPRGLKERETVPEKTDTGAQLDGTTGTGTAPFLTLPDANGNTYGFGIAWPMSGDGYGSAITKAHGYGSEHLGVTVDNSDIYRLCYKVLFDKDLD